MKYLRIHYRKLFFAILFFSCAIGLIILSCSSKQKHAPFYEGLQREVHSQQIHSIKNELNRNFSSPQFQAKRELSDVTLKFLSTLMQEEKCPVCFGYEVCEEINVEFIKFDSTTPIIQGGDYYKVYEGKLGNLQKILIKVPNSIKNFDEQVCTQDSLTHKDTPRCKLHQNLIKSLPFSSETYSDIISMQEKLGLRTLKPFFLTCRSSKLENIMISAFDYNEDASFNKDEKIVLYTSMVLTPEVIASKILTKIGLNSAFSRYVGACGRALVFEGGMKPLSLYLDSPFNQRVSLALQLLTHIQSFVDSNPDWVVLQPHWELESISVNANGEVIFTDMRDLLITPKLSKDEEASKACGSECLMQLKGRISSTSGEGCLSQNEASNFMFAHLCLSILSDMKQHKFIDYFSKPSSSKTKHRPWLGLLHSIPDNEKQDIEHFLSLCVDETASGERIVAAEDLQDLFSDILDEEEVDYEDSEGPDENEEEEDDYEDNGEDQQPEKDIYGLHDQVNEGKEHLPNAHPFKEEY